MNAEKQCTHCNGYGSSMKDPEGVDTCTKCHGSGIEDWRDKYIRKFSDGGWGIYPRADSTAIAKFSDIRDARVSVTFFCTHIEKELENVG